MHSLSVYSGVMAKKEHLILLKQGVETWNKWRADNSDISLDLTWASLSKANLVGADLSNVNLRGAFLRGSDLRNANLKRANLMGTNLNEANLSGALLEEANLTRANLVSSILSFANLSSAILTDSDLIKANLRGAVLKNTKNLTVRQLSRVETLYTAELDMEMKEQVLKTNPHLFQKPEN